jgi:hypothetical protein
MIFNFSALLNNFRVMQNSHVIEDLLAQEDSKVEDLLNHEDELMLEVRYSNENLMKFLTLENLEILVDYITIVPNEDSDSDRKHKYPFVSSKVLSHNSQMISNALIEKEILVIRLFEFLRSEDDVNFPLASYVCKVL